MPANGRSVSPGAAALLLVLAAASVPTSDAVTSPLETRYFDAPVVSMNKIGVLTTGTVDDLQGRLSAAVTAGTVSEFRIVQETAAQGVFPEAGAAYWVEIWYNGAQNYLNAHGTIMSATPCQPGDGSCLAYLLTTGIGTCKLCRGTDAYVPIDTEWHGYFINDQSRGAYPIQAFFQASLPLTAAEAGTLDYAMTKRLTKITSTELEIDMNDVSFFEIYDGAEAFAQHVVNVNRTLAVQGAPNWFTDLGSVFSKWFYVKHRSSWCSYCKQPPSTFWAGQDTNPGRAGGGNKSPTGKLSSSTDDGKVQHVVLLNIRGDATRAQLAALDEAADAMQDLGYVERLSFGQAYQTNDLSLYHRDYPTFNYALLVTHPNKEAAAKYQTDPIHVAFKNALKPLLEDGGCGKVWTLDTIAPVFEHTSMSATASAFIGLFVGLLVGAVAGGMVMNFYLKKQLVGSGGDAYRTMASRPV